MTATVDITDYVAGDSLAIEFTVLQPDGSVFPDLDLCTIAWKLDQTAPLGVGANLLSKSLGHGVTLLSADIGTVSVVIDPGEIPSIGAMLHSLVITTDIGHIYTACRGEIVANSALS